MKQLSMEDMAPERYFLVVWWIIVTFGKSISIIRHSSLRFVTLHLLSTLCVIVIVAVHLRGSLRVVGVAHVRLLSIVDAIATLLIVTLLREATLLLLVHAFVHVLAIALRTRMHRTGLLAGRGYEVRSLFLGGSLVVVRSGGHDGCLKW